MFKQYLKSTSGNVAMMFGAVSTLVLLGVGVAVDYNGMSASRTQMQNLADAAVLAAAVSGETKKPELLQIAKDAVSGNNFDGKTYNVSLKLSNDGFITVDVSSNYQMAIMGLFGKKNADVVASAEAPMAVDQILDLALVLDATYSMNGAKLDNLKTAAIALVDALDGDESDNIRISVIPFEQYVNVGLSRRDEPWIDVPADTSTTLPENCYMRKDTISSENCVTTESTCNSDGVDYSCSSTSCDKTYGPEYEYCYIPTSSQTWRGCVGSRNAPWNERARKGVALIPGLMNQWCGEEILPLTGDFDAVRSKISSITVQPGDTTYIPQGLVWGWRAVNNEEPLTEAASNNGKDNYKKVVVLMTDGANQHSAINELHTGSDIDEANNLTRRMCLNIRSQQIDMYTIAYDFNGVDTLDVLQKCATRADNYFQASNGTELIQAFEDIASSLKKVRLSN